MYDRQLRPTQNRPKIIVLHSYENGSGVRGSKSYYLYPGGESNDGYQCRIKGAPPDAAAHVAVAALAIRAGDSSEVQEDCITRGAHARPTVQGDLYVL